ncbi:MAG TPA: hypothetical protein PLA68_10285, partial [Panacibacter sp.]|nr:hypothetical protein [Panacibacter sp.]
RTNCCACVRYCAFADKEPTKINAAAKYFILNSNCGKSIRKGFVEDYAIGKGVYTIGKSFIEPDSSSFGIASCVAHLYCIVIMGKRNNLAKESLLQPSHFKTEWNFRITGVRCK